MPLILLDRDGTLIEDKHYLHDPAEVELLPGVVEGLKALKRVGCAIVVVSNQSGVGRGYFTDEDVEACNERLQELLEEEGATIDDFYWCPHSPDEGCSCRKPSTGLGEQACEEFDVDPDEVFVIGDKPCDVDLGQALGGKSVLVSTGYGADSFSDCHPDFHAADFQEATEWIIDQVGS